MMVFLHYLDILLTYLKETAFYLNLISAVFTPLYEIEKNIFSAEPNSPYLSIGRGRAM